MKGKIKCDHCRGKGWLMQEEEDNDENDLVILSFIDCPSCEGLGYNVYTVTDKRKQSKKKKTFLPEFF